jgi:hypothetical protein
MANEAARLYFDDAAIPSTLAPESGVEASSSAWPDASDQLALVLDGSRFEAMLAEAASWADRITVCVTAPHSQHGALPWWGELLARGSKCDRIYLRRAEQTEGWLLHQLYDTGALRLLDSGGRQVASNLLIFVRQGELRVLLSHLPLERAVAGAAFGTLLAFRGSSSAEFARSCRVQLASWTERARIPTGGEVGSLAFTSRRALPPSFTPPSGTRLVSDPVQMEAGLRRVLGPSAELSPFAGGYRVQLRRAPAAQPFVLTLHAGAGWAAGNGLLFEAAEQRMLLVWRGGLLGHSRSRSELLWSEARLNTFEIDGTLPGGAERVAVVAVAGAPAPPQVECFLRELSRLGDVFNVEPPPVLGHALADFTTLNQKQQQPLLWRALLGLGTIDFERAVDIAARVLRDQGYLSSRGSEPGGALQAVVALLLDEGVEAGLAFDRPSSGSVRAIQPDPSQYLCDDWRQCLLQSLPVDEAVPRRTAIELAFLRARDVWGLAEPRLVRGSAVERQLESALASALARGLLLASGAGSVVRLSPLAAAPEQPAPSGAAGESFVAAFRDALERLSPLERTLLSRRSGVHGAREPLERLARRLGLPSERAAQLEAQAWQRLEHESELISTARARLERALGGARSVPVALLVSDDAWWLGVEQRLELVAALFEGGLGGELHVLELGQHRFFARFGEAELERARAQLRERAGQVITPALLDDYAALAAEAASALDPALAPYLCEALERELAFDPEQAGRVLGLVPPAQVVEDDSVPEPFAPGSESYLRLQDSILAAFRTARAPMSLSAIAARVRLRMDAPDHALEEVLPLAPFARLGDDEYGLLSRDVAGGHEAIAAALDGVVTTLAADRRPLEATRALSLMHERAGQGWPGEVLRSLLASDPALIVGASGEVGLRSWLEPGDAAPREPLCAGVPAALRARFAALAAQAPGKPGELERRVRAELGRLERALDAEDFVSASLARQLCDLHERLLERAPKLPAPAEKLAQASARYFLEAVACDEDAIEPQAVPRATLLEARSVLAAVLERLELDWL